VRRLLIIDDDAELGGFMQRLLAGDGYHAHVAATPAAIEQALVEDWDLIFLDVSMPETNGWTVAKRIRQAGKNCPVYFMSAYADPKFETARREGLVQGLLQKPFDYGMIRDFLTMTLP
jgi:CheY-like chemotaxis protein